MLNNNEHIGIIIAINCGFLKHQKVNPKILSIDIDISGIIKNV